ncbi:hypothetical protein ABPG75_012538 [Micractinium tetrahymenae]
MIEVGGLLLLSRHAVETATAVAAAVAELERLAHVQLLLLLHLWQTRTHTPAVVQQPWRQAAASLGAAAAAAAMLVLGAPSAGAADLRLGAEVFENNCAVCHAGGLNNIAGEEKHTLKRDALEKYGLFSPEAIISQVNNGKDAMPPFRDMLTLQEIEAVAAFVLDQAAGNKW